MMAADADVSFRLVPQGDTLRARDSAAAKARAARVQVHSHKSNGGIIMMKGGPTTR